MAEVTVKQLADTVGRTVDILLAQMREAGLSHDSADAPVSDAEKQQLLAHLKRAHGEQAGEPKKITLQRKTVSTLKTGAAVGGKAKTVNVEVRKTRTYVKRSLLEEQEEKAREAEEAARKRAEAEAAEREKAEASRAEQTGELVGNSRSVSALAELTIVVPKGVTDSEAKSALANAIFNLKLDAANVVDIDWK